jgi:hypothetical protein
MPKTTVSAAGGAMPAAGRTSRRSLLSALAASPLALPAVAAIPAIAGAAPAVADATILALAAKLADASERLTQLIRGPMANAETAFRARKLPERPEMRPLADSPEVAAARERFVEAAREWWKLPSAEMDKERHRRETRSWQRRVRHWERKTGLAEARAAEGRLHEEVGQLEYELLHTPAKSFADLQAKAKAWDGDDPYFAEAIVRELREFADL